jgi:hypothetical protein
MALGLKQDRNCFARREPQLFAKHEASDVESLLSWLGCRLDAQSHVCFAEISQRGSHPGPKKGDRVVE